MKELPHRLRDGRCRDCGHYDASSAPTTCTRCTVQRVIERGYEIVSNPVPRFELWGQELWRHVAVAVKSGAIKAGRFYLYVGHNDGGALGLPMGDLTAQEWEVADSHTARETAAALTRRYPEVWIVTTVGCWDTNRTGTAA